MKEQYDTAEEDSSPF
jgi:hypothetical protein